MKNIVIITQVFPPVEAIGARRFGEIAPYLSEFGYRPWIITTRVEDRTTYSLPREQIIEFGQYSRGSLGEAKWASDIPMVRRIERYGFRPVYLDPSLFSWAPLVWKARKEIIARVGRVDAIIGSFGPASAFWLAKKLADDWRVPWIADFRDLAALRENERVKLIRNLDAFIEQNWIKHARAITTVSPSFASLLEAEYSKPANVIYNGFDEKAVEKLDKNTPLDSRIHRPFLHYAGQIYPNQLESFKLVLQSLTKIPRIQLVFRILGPRHLETLLQQEAQILGLTDRVLFLQPAERKVVTFEAESCLASLIVAQMYEPSRGTLPAKVFSLLPLDPPILGVGPDDSDIGNLIRETKKGVLCRDETEILNFLNSASTDLSSFVGDEVAIQRYSKRSQTKRLAEFLDSLLF